MPRTNVAPHTNRHTGERTRASKFSDAHRSCPKLPIPEGAKILCVLGSANLDPEKWPNADKFDFERKPREHLVFGSGIHGCVGQSVVRQETEAVLTAVATKVEAIELAGDPVWRPGNSIHALDRLPLRITRRS
ncbi:MAG: cytochrome P450 [Hyphomicrobiaceae bacterium]